MSGEGSDYVLVVGSRCAVIRITTSKAITTYLRSWRPAAIRGHFVRDDHMFNTKTGAVNTSTGRPAKMSLSLGPSSQGAAWFWTSLMASRWTGFAVVMHLVVALFLFSRLLVGLAFACRLVQSSNPIHDSRLTLSLPRVRTRRDGGSCQTLTNRRWSLYP